MISGILLAGLLLQAPGVPPPQTPLPSTQSAKGKASPPPPTPWFTKDEDTFDLPADPRHLDELKHDVDEGKKEAEEVLKETKASTNMAYQERVERIGQQIAHIANHMHAIATWGDKRFSPYHYRYTVLEGEDVNAFSLPGGYIFVFEGLLKYVESDDELAGVLAHETAHAAFRHVATLEHDSNRTNLLQIPMILAAILAHSPEAAIGSELLLQAVQSGWSISAEEAADYGGFQFMCKSPYNPVAMLTFMERLAKSDNFMDSIVRNTLMQTHPVTRDRALAMINDLQSAGIPIERSKASPAFRVALKDNKDGTVDASFNKIPLYKFAGANAKSRALEAAKGLDKFYDSVPAMYMIIKDSTHGQIEYKGRAILSIDPADAAASNMSSENLLDKTVSAIKDSVFNLGYITWEGPGF